jgi:hypothetical protein
MGIEDGLDALRIRNGTRRGVEMFPTGGQRAGHGTIHSAGPDGGIGRHSGLKIVYVTV